MLKGRGEIQGLKKGLGINNNFLYICKMSYKPGSKVVCVNDEFDLTDPVIRSMVRPKKDIVYTVRDCEEGMVRLEEISNKEMPMYFGGVILMVEPGFAQNRFAPLLDNRDELTENMLNTLKLDVKEYEYLEIEETEEIGVV